MGKEEKTTKKIVFDTNIMISALLFKGELSRIVDLWKKNKITPVLSIETFKEFKSVLEYPKFSLTEQEISVIIEEDVLPYFEIVEIVDKLNGICRDRNDDKFIECALAASADFIVSGDRDLLSIGKYSSVSVINASALLRMF